MTYMPDTFKSYRKRPVVIEALVVTPETRWPTEIPVQYHTSPPEGWVVYDDLHGSWIRFEVEDYIIRGLKGEYYPCKPDVFAASYEEVGNDQ